MLCESFMHRRIRPPQSTFPVGNEESPQSKSRSSLHRRTWRLPQFGQRLCLTALAASAFIIFLVYNRHRSNDAASVLVFSDLPLLLHESSKLGDLTIGLAVSNEEQVPLAGDLNVARGLAKALKQEWGWSTILLQRTDEIWYGDDSLSRLDVVIVMLDAYDWTKVSRKHRERIIKMAWMRNWFERWETRPGFDAYDIILSASTSFAHELRQRIGAYPPVYVLRLAVDPETFPPRSDDDRRTPDDRIIDYCFTGNYWKFPRDIERLNPTLLLTKYGYKGAVFGGGWRQHPDSNLGLLRIYGGTLNYSNELPKLYHRCRLVLDDSNHVTKPFGSLNSRVYEALAAGTMVMTNNVLGAQETFGEWLPTWSGNSNEELEMRIHDVLKDEQQFRGLVKHLQSEVLTLHTYKVRAVQLGNVIERAVTSRSVGSMGKQHINDNAQIMQVTADSAILNGNLSNLSDLNDEVCFIVRTFPTQRLAFRTLLLNLNDIASSSAHPFDVSIIAANTDHYRHWDTRFMLEESRHFASLSTSRIKFHVALFPDLYIPDATLYAYDVTDAIVRTIVDTKGHRLRCDRFIFTNGDNLYNRKLLDRIHYTIQRDPKFSAAQLIAFDYVTHHPRGNPPRRNQVIKVAFERKFVDLGSVLVSKSAIKPAYGDQVKFVPEGYNTPEPFARDYFFFNHLIQKQIPYALLHEVLFFHQ